MSNMSNFNTSHVSINLEKVEEAGLPDGHFNTSHVSINRSGCHKKREARKISIHLMFLLIFPGAVDCA